MNTTTSQDGTVIAYEKLGSGPVVVLVDGAMCSRTFGPMPQLAPLLTDKFTVVHYDRRGRGDSGNTLPYTVDRELEDLRAVVDAVAKGGDAPYLYGTSSGAMLAMRAVASGLVVKKLVVHEPPLSLDGTRTPDPPDFREQIAAHVAADRRGDAVKLFMKVVGVPAFGIFIMSLIPKVWRSTKAVAHTLPYDFAILGETQSGGPMPTEVTQKLAAIRVPTLALVGGKSPPYMHHSVKRVAETIAGTAVRVLPGQEHNVAAKAVAPVLREFFGA